MLKIARDVPGSRLVLVHAGPIPHLIGRIVLTVVLMPVAASVPFAILSKRPDPLAPVVPLLFAWALVFAWAASELGKHLGTWTWFSWDREKESFRARFSGRFMIWGTREYRIPLSSLRGGVFDVAVGGRHGLPIAIRIRHDDQAGRPHVTKAALRIADIDGRVEGLDFVFRIARVIGWRGYAVRRSDASVLRLELFLEQPPRSAGLPVPAVGTPAGTAGAAGVGRFEAPTFEIPSFNPRRLGDRYRVTVWDPGRSLELIRVALSSGDLTFAGIFGGALGAIVGLLVLAPGLTASTGARLLIVAAATGAGAVAYLAAVAWRERARETEMDWSTGKIEIRDGRSVRKVWLTDVEAVSVWGVVRPDRKERCVKYRCVIELGLPGPDRPVAETQEAADPEAPLVSALPMAVELARALKVPWRWMGYPAVPEEEEEEEAVEAAARDVEENEWPLTGDRPMGEQG